MAELTDSPSEEALSRESALRARVRSLQLPPLDRRRSVPWLPITLIAGLLVGGYFLRERFSVWFAATRELLNPSTETDPSASNESAKTTTNEPSGKAADSAAKTPIRPQAAVISRDGLVLESKGYIIPAHRILVSPKVSGMLVILRIEEGMRVAKDEILGEIEADDYQADLDRTIAILELAKERLRELDTGSREDEISQAEADVAEAKAKRVQAESDFKRARQLFQSGNGTQAEFDQKAAEFESTQRRFDRASLALKLLVEGPREERKAQARAEVRQAQADVDKAKWRRENCTIRSSIAGTILKKNAEQGNLVNPIAQNGSFSLCEMADLSDLEAELNIQERDISRVFVGQKCKVRTDAFPDRIYEGIVSRIMPYADRGKGALPVRVKISVPREEEGIYLKPDMGAIVSFFGSPTAANTSPKTNTDATP